MTLLQVNISLRDSEAAFPDTFYSSMPSPCSKFSEAMTPKSESMMLSAISSPFIDLDDYLLLSNIFSFLGYEDLNSLAVCCKRLKHLRADPSLDQTRSGTLVFTGKYKDSPLYRFRKVIREKNLPKVFQGNRTVLRIRGYLENFDDSTLMQHFPTETMECVAPALEGVETLDLSDSRRPADPRIKVDCAFPCAVFQQLLPNIQTLDLSCTEPSQMETHRIPTTKANQTNRIDVSSHLIWWKSVKTLSVAGRTLNEIYLSPNIQRLDVRGVVGRRGDPLDEMALSEILRHRNLKSLLCDASPAVLHRLRLERPDVAVVVE